MSATTHVAASGVASTKKLWAVSAWSLILLFLVWMLGGSATRFVPSVGEVASAAPDFFLDPATWSDILITGRRVVVSLVAALAIALIAASIVHEGRTAGKVIGHYVQVGVGVPSTIAALLALFIFRRQPIGVYVVVTLITAPFMTLSLIAGLKASDKHLRQMADSYRLGRWTRFRHIAIPHLAPYTFAALRNENAHAWRVVVLAELFAVSNGMGARFSRAFDRFLLIDVMLWLLAFMLILLLTEYLVLRPLESRSTSWRAS